MPNKHDDDRHYHIPNMTFKVTNWSSYEAAGQPDTMGQRHGERGLEGAAAKDAGRLDALLGVSTKNRGEAQAPAALNTNPRRYAQ